MLKLFPIRQFLDLRATIAIFTVALFVSTIWALAHEIDAKVRVNFKEALALQQFKTVEHVARSLDEAVKLRISALADVATLINPELLDHRVRMQGFLAERMPLERFFDAGITVVSRDGVGVAALPNLEGRDGARYADRDYFRDVIASGNPAVGRLVVSQFTKKPVTSIAVPIKNAKSEVIGVLVGANYVSGSDLLSEILPSKLQMDGDIHVVSTKDGLVVSSTDPSSVLRPDPTPGFKSIYERYRQGYEGSGIALNSQGVESLISAKRIPSTGWLVVATLPTAIAFKPLESLQKGIYKDAALASALIALLIWLFLQRQFSPLSRSAQTIDAMADGREKLRPLPLEGSAEIRRLLDSFNKLQEQIKKQQLSLRERAEQLRIAASVFEGTSESILVSSAENNIVSVNNAFCKMTGYAESELVGQNPRLLQSGRHPLSFYKEMWSSLQNTGQWQGEIWNRRKNGEIYPERLTISALYDEVGKVLRYVAIAADITARKKAEDEINSLAFYDPLTDLPNRRLLLDRLRQAMAASARSERHGALLFIDLDDFKTINDSLGHNIGDLLLQQVAQRLVTCVREGDTVARLGGDEFVVMLEDLSEDALEAATQTETVGEKIFATLNQPYQLASYKHHSTPSIGVALFTDHHGSADELLKRADLAMYQAKATGRNTLRFFDPEMQAVVVARAALETDLREAVLKDQFLLYYQAQVVGEGRLVGAEVLVRWMHPARAMVLPLEFILMAEHTGLILPLGNWVLQTACRQLAIWANRPEMADLTLAVNVSARQLRMPNFVDEVLAAITRSGANPQRLKLELTESLMVDDVEDTIGKMTALKAKGVKFSLDDFGTGYSSLSYLKRLPLDQLKIDRSFVRDILTDSNDAAIARMVVSLAESMGLTVIAEGVETEAQRDFLSRQGCHAYQGYLFSRPLPLDDFEAYAKSPNASSVNVKPLKLIR